MVIPFVSDLLSEWKEEESLDQFTVGFLKRFSLTAFNKQSYCAIGQGTGGQLALKLQFFDLKCVHAVVLNPLLEIEVVQED